MQRPIEMTRSMTAEMLRTVLLLGIALVVLIPAAREVHAGIGWLPLWLVGMPGSAWLVAQGLTREMGVSAGVARRRRPGVMRGPVAALEAGRRVPRAPRDEVQRVA